MKARFDFNGPVEAYWNGKEYNGIRYIQTKNLNSFAKNPSFKQEGKFRPETGALIPVGQGTRDRLIAAAKALGFIQE